MPPEEAELGPAARSIVARLRVISLVVWAMCTATGAVIGASFALSALHESDMASWYKFALVVVVICSGVVGCFIGYLAKVVIDWARQVLVLLGHIARKD
jgi:uncharacterized membrane protein (DUF106 family)